MRVFCSICKEIFISSSTVKITNCGHLYHDPCISRWSKQHKTCPQCRANLTVKPFKVYFDVETDGDVDASALEHKVQTLSDKIFESETAYNKLLEEKKECESALEVYKTKSFDLKKENHTLTLSLKALKLRLSQRKKDIEEIARLGSEVEKWKEKATALQKVELVLTGSSEKVEKMLQSVPVNELSVKYLCTYVGALKDQLDKCELKNVKLIKENKELEKTLSEEKRKTCNEEEVGILKTKCNLLEKEINLLRRLLREAHKTSMSRDFNFPSTQVETSKGSQKKPSFDVDIDLDVNIDTIKPIKKPKTNQNDEFSKSIKQWENLVCAGPSKTFQESSTKSLYQDKYDALFSKKKSSYAFKSNNENNESPRSNVFYAWDGMGGRKKIRLGGPTPREEFEKIKKTESKKSSSSSSTKKIFEFYGIKTPE